MGTAVVRRDVANSLVGEVARNSGVLVILLARVLVEVEAGSPNRSREMGKR
jgi:hypothetical protein